MRAAVQAIARAAGPDDRPDSDLVAAFVRHADGPAFAALVRRHGPMVYRVCVRVAGNAHDAEDAAQAAFLALARHARSIRRRQSVAPWLHGVAVRVARKARERATRQLRREQAVARPERIAAADPSWAEVRGVLDAELAALPDRLRQPLVLCYLQGRTRDEAAKALGWSPATLGRRLEAARDALGRRLRARGVVGAAALPAVLVSDAATGGTFPSELVAACVDHALAAAGRTGTPIPPAVAELCQGVTRTMTRNMLVGGAVVGLVAAAVAGGAGDDKPLPADPPPTKNREEDPRLAVDPKLAADGKYVVVGKVRTADGKVPLEGVEVHVSTGVGTLRRAAEAKTDTDGRFRLVFGGGGRPRGMAIVSVRKPGWHGWNHGWGPLYLLFDKRPDPRDVTPGYDPLIPGEPSPLEFRMQPAAALRLKLVDGAGKPLANTRVWLTGDRTPPGGTVIENKQTDADGMYVVEDVPRDNYRLVVVDYRAGDPVRDRADLELGSVRFRDAAVYEAVGTVREWKPDGTADVSLKVVRGKDR